MSPDERTARVLAGLDPAFAVYVRQVLAAMAALNVPMVAYDGRRSLAQQQAEYAKGRTAPGRRVTDCDGVRKRSLHQDGRAVDCAFLVWPAPRMRQAPSDRRWGLSWDGPWHSYGAIGEHLGLRWGGRWRESAQGKGDGWDRPHLEWPR